MTVYHLGRNDQQLGQYDEATLREGLQDGRFLPTDLVWKTGMASWKPLGDVLKDVKPRAQAQVSPSATATATAASTATPPAETEKPGQRAERFRSFAPSREEKTEQPRATASAAPTTPSEKPRTPEAANWREAAAAAAATPPPKPAKGEIPVPKSAVASLLLGLVSLFSCFFGVLFAIPGIVCGHKALAALRQPGSPYKEGQGLAVGGLWCSYLGLILGLVMLGVLAVMVYMPKALEGLTVAVP